MKETIAFIVLFLVSSIAIYTRLKNKAGNTLLGMLLTFALVSFFVIYNVDVIKSLKWQGLEVESFKRDVETIKDTALSGIKRQIDAMKADAKATEVNLDKQKQELETVINTSKQATANLNEQRKNLEAVMKQSKQLASILTEQRKNLESLSSKTEASQEQIAIILQFSEVAMIGLDGNRSMGGGASVPTIFTGWSKGAVKVNGNAVTWTCSPSDIGLYKSFVHRHIAFPFPYIPLASCLKAQNDKRWSLIAKDGLSLFERIVTMQHTLEHDWGLRYLTGLLENDDRPVFIREKDH